MEEKSTLFEYLYRNLREQIMTGYLKYGDPLPSMSQLCENYHVGIRTVKAVLAALKRVAKDRTVISISHRTSAELGRTIQI